MIQRIQTVYLLLAVVISAVISQIFNLWEYADGMIFYVKDALTSNHFLIKMIPILFGVSATLSFIAIFIFKNRKLQFVLGRINILVNLFLLGLLLYQSLNLSGETIVSKKGIGLVLPIIVVLLLVMANKAIKKDEDLVKSVDRLR